MVSSSDDLENDAAACLSLIAVWRRLRNKRKARSNRPHKRRRIERNREEGYNQLYNDYFAPQPTYPDNVFRRRFRMRKHVFLRVLEGVKAHNPYFHQLPDATRRLGISDLQKCTAAIWLLAYGEAADRVDEYLRLSSSTARIALHEFTDAVIAQFGDVYIRSPTTDDLKELLRVNKKRGFPGMIGSIDCMHWTWKNCPTAWKGQYQGRDGTAFVILEAVALKDLWIWHCLFGLPGTLNDLTILYRSHIFDDLLNGRAPVVEYVVNGRRYDTPYYLTDGIYPNWSAFMKSIPLPQTPKERLFAEQQESVRKDVECAFGVLQARWAIIRHPAMTWDKEMLTKIMKTCIILHNMIVEDERYSYPSYDDPNEFNDESDEDVTTVELSQHSIGYVNRVEEYITKRTHLEDSSVNLTLRNDLIEHIWKNKERQENSG